MGCVLHSISLKYLFDLILKLSRESLIAESKLTAAEITEMITTGLNRLTTDESEERFTDKILVNVLGGTDENGCWLPVKEESVRSTCSFAF